MRTSRWERVQIESVSYQAQTQIIGWVTGGSGSAFAFRVRVRVEGLPVYLRILASISPFSPAATPVIGVTSPDLVWGLSAVLDRNG